MQLRRIKRKYIQFHKLKMQKDGQVYSKNKKQLFNIQNYRLFQFFFSNFDYPVTQLFFWLQKAVKV